MDRFCLYTALECLISYIIIKSSSRALSRRRPLISCQKQRRRVDFTVLLYGAVYNYGAQTATTRQHIIITIYIHKQSCTRIYRYLRTSGVGTRCCSSNIAGECRIKTPLQSPADTPVANNNNNIIITATINAQIGQLCAAVTPRPCLLGELKKKRKKSWNHPRRIRIQHIIIYYDNIIICSSIAFDRWYVYTY